VKFRNLVASTLLVSGLAGAAACAQETSADPAPAPPEFAVADVEANPDAWREVEPENMLVFETTKGRIVIEMLPVAAPNHVKQFSAIAKSGLYAGTPFHRVIDDFMDQGGDIRSMNGVGSGLPDLKGEFTFRVQPGEMEINPVGPMDTATRGLYKGFPIATQAAFLSEMTGDASVDRWIPHCPGVVSTARTDDPNSANSQFFLMRYQADHLDKKYTAWGRVIDGFDVVRAIKKGPEPNGSPIAQPDVLQKAYVVSDLPTDKQMKAWVQRTDTPEWTERLAAADQADKDICDVMRVPAVIAE
jgi:peptidylprolyl isomerase